jgi:hypothetical protein
MRRTSSIPISRGSREHKHYDVIHHVCVPDDGLRLLRTLLRRVVQRAPLATLSITLPMSLPSVVTIVIVRHGAGRSRQPVRRGRNGLAARAFSRRDGSVAQSTERPAFLAVAPSVALGDVSAAPVSRRRSPVSASILLQVETKANARSADTARQESSKTARSGNDGDKSDNGFVRLQVFGTMSP